MDINLGLTWPSFFAIKSKTVVSLRNIKTCPRRLLPVGHEALFNALILALLKYVETLKPVARGASFLFHCWWGVKYDNNILLFTQGIFISINAVDFVCIHMEAIHFAFTLYTPLLFDGNLKTAQLCLASVIHWLFVCSGSNRRYTTVNSTKG